MSQVLEMAAMARQEVGRGETRAICKREGYIPGVVYGAAKENSNIYLIAKDINHALQKPAFHSRMIHLSIDGKKTLVMLKDVHIHPNKGTAMHVDFMRITANAAIKIMLPLVFSGESKAPGVKAGGVVTHQLMELLVKCKPADLPEHISVDASKLALGASLHVSDIKLPKGVSLVHPVDNDHNPAVISIHETRVTSTEDAGDSQEASDSQEA